jgi:hypothetical protein
MNFTAPDLAFEVFERFVVEGRHRSAVRRSSVETQLDGTIS